MKKEPEAITTFLQLDAALKPFVSKVSENKKKIENLTKGLQEYETKFFAIEAKLTQLLKESEQALSEGKGIRFSDAIFSTRQEKEDLSGWINQIQNETLPAAKAALETAIKELSQKFLEEINPLRLSYLERVRVIYAQGDAIWDSYLMETKTMMREMQEKHDISFPLWEIDQLFIKDFRKLLKKE